MTTDEEALFGQLEDVFAKVDAEEVVDLNTLTNAELIEKLAEVEVYIKDSEQWLHPKDQGARDAHSERNAIQLVLEKRNFER